MGVPVQNILFTVFQSILQVFLLCLAGFTLSFNGIVDKPTSKVLNHINIALFTPALLFSKVAYFLSPAKLRQLWIIPLFFVTLTSLSAVVAHYLARACRLKRSQVNFATAASMFMNSNSLPVALMQSLATTVPVLKWGQDDTIDAMFGRSLTYLVVFSTLGMILRWSYGVHLLSQTDGPESLPAPPPTTYRDVDDHHPPLPVDRSPTSLADYETEPDTDPRDSHVWRIRTRSVRSRLLSCRHTHLHVHHSHLPAVPTSLGDQSESEDSDEVDTTEGDSEDTIALRSEPLDTEFSTEAEDHAPASAPIPSSSGVTPRWDRPPRPPFFRGLYTTLMSLSPPLVASLLALFCVLVPPIQRLLQSEDMIPFKGALDNAGACSVPVTMLVLGGWFWDGEPQPKRKAADSKSASNGQGSAKNQGKAKGKGVAQHRTKYATQHADLQSHSSSTASLTSMIGTFGDVLMGRIRSRLGNTARRSGRLTKSTSTVDANTADEDVEAAGGPYLATHAETEIEHAENRRAVRSRSRSRPSAIPSSAPASLSSAPPAPGNPPGETLTIIITLLARMILVPLVVTPIMILVSRLGWGGEVFEDPVFIVSSMLLVASPPALTLAQISQRATTTPATGADATADANAFSPFERLLSRTVFWAYLVLTPPLTILSVMVGLLLVES